VIRLLVTGGRYYDDEAKLNAVLDCVARKHDIEVLIEGECPMGGADRLARLWARAHDVPLAQYWIEHHRDGPWPQAGRNRNVRMFEESHPTHGVAFPGGSGTRHMVSVLREHDVPVWVIK
jgi:hypothetical protein